ncbi:endonuclease [Poriferisphaera corsica]|nr:endonuclease [Poriferisphaera corsica]
MDTIKFSTASLLTALLLTTSSFAVSYDAPSNYYNNATSTGSTLKSQLRQIMTSGHRPTSYDDLKYSARYTDTDPNNPNNMLLIYNRASNKSSWDSAKTWNREHIWPQSKQSSGSNKSDQHALRPCNPGLNSSRGNLTFGGTYGSSMGRHGSYWYTGDADAGDVARSLFYSATRYSHLSLGESSGSNKMGKLSDLIQWHYLDTPDEFELRRNHAVYGGAVDNYRGGTYINPEAQNNRNAYIDRPEYAWSVYMDQQNDTQLYFGSSAQSNGSSTLDVNFGRVIKGATGVNTSYAALLNKKGNDGTYYEVKADANVQSSVNGRYNAFAMNKNGNKSINVSLDADTNTAGKYRGSLVVDNLDVTTQGGNGRGANDGNDSVNLELTVVENATASFDARDEQQGLVIDFGDIKQNILAQQSFEIYNYTASAFTAHLDLDSILSGGDSDMFDIDLATFKNLEADNSNTFTAALDTDQIGELEAQYILNFSNEDLPGSANEHSLFLTVKANVISAVPEPASLALFGLAGVILASRKRNR